MIKEKSQTWHQISQKMGCFFANYSPFPAGFYTLSSLLLAIIAIVLSYHTYFISAIGLFILAGLFDVIDGSVARARNKASNLGAFVDGTIDRFVDFSIIFSFFFFHIQAPILTIAQLICITSFVVIMPTFIVAYANHRGAVEDDNETLIWRIMNRGEMLVMMLAILIMSLYNPLWAGYLLVALIMLSALTILQTIIETIYHGNKWNRA